MREQPSTRRARPTFRLKWEATDNLTTNTLTPDCLRTRLQSEWPPGPVTPGSRVTFH
jgi:hypothetical protein